MKTLRKLRALPRVDRLLLVEAAWWLVVARLLIALMSFNRIAHHLGLQKVDVSWASASKPDAECVGWAVRVVASRLPRAGSCLTQAVACWVMLRRRGIESALVLGVAKDDPDGMVAHAWLKVGDEILTGARGMSRFTPLSAFTSSAMHQSSAETWEKHHAVGTALALHAELIRVTKAFAAAEVPVVAFKGVTLGLRAYQGVAARRFRDNDILVRTADTERAYALLLELGYEPCLRRDLNTSMRRTHELRMSWRGLDLELHWNAFDASVGPVDEEAVWAHVEPFEDGDLKCLVFDPYLTLVHLAYHYSVHGFSWVKILRDIAESWNTWHEQIDVTELGAVAKRCGQLPMVAIAFERTREAFLVDAQLPTLHSSRAKLALRLLKTQLGGTQQGCVVVRQLLTRPDRAVRNLVGYAFPPTDVFPLVYRERSRSRRFLRPLELAMGLAVGTLARGTRSRTHM